MKMPKSLYIYKNLNTLLHDQHGQHSVYISSRQAMKWVDYSQQ